jgi:outer membrane protein
MNTIPMKQAILATLLLLCSASASFAQNAIKIGHIDRQRLLLTLPERKGAEEKMQAFAKTLDERLKAMGGEYQAKVADAQERADKGALSETEKQMLVREINDLEQRIESAREKAQEDIAKMEEELLKPMIEKTNKAIKDVAEEKSFTYVLDVSTGSVLYFDRGEDLMPLVKAKLGIQ